MSTVGAPLRLCVVSFKPCWRDAAGRWISSGGFPLQMAAIGSLFDETKLLIAETGPQGGGIPLPPHAAIVPLREPSGDDARRKVSVAVHLPSYLWTIASHVRRADVVHTPLPGDLALLGFAVAFALRKPLIARYGGSWPDNPQTTLTGRLTKAWMRRAAGGRNVMLATGDGGSPPAPGMSWIFATALSERELSGPPPELDCPPGNPPRLVYVGRLSPEKGVATLLQALARLATRPDAPAPELTLVGGGEDRDRLQELARRLGLSARVHLTGQLTREALAAELSRADICVQPSLTEGFSKAWLDAMARGLPVLASDVGAAGAVIGGDGERGWLVPPGDATTLAETLHQVLTRPLDWPALRRRCRTYAERHTLEAWTLRIGQTCAAQWGWSLVDGKLRP
jgi:glycosyltransferase involved in cell wall biosynthesis